MTPTTRLPLVERLRQQPSNLKPPQIIAKWRVERQEAAALIEKQGVLLATLIEALTPFSDLGEVVLAEAPADAEAVWSFASCDGRPHLIGLEASALRRPPSSPPKPWGNGNE